MRGMPLRASHCKLQAVSFKPQASSSRAYGLWLAACGLLLSCLPQHAHAQDIHFSQFFNAPYAQNPANIGQFEGEFRMAAIYRQQWRSVTTPYGTFGIGGDAADLAGIKGLGLGLWAYSDKAGDAHLKTSHADLGVSWTRRFGEQHEHALTVGTQVGISAVSIDYSALRFDAQFNGFNYDPSLGNAEQFTRDARSRLDLHAGIAYRYAPEARRNVDIGLAVFNLTTPDVSLFDAAPSPLDLRPLVHAGAQFPVGDKLDVLPQLQWQAQGTYREFDAGGLVRYILLDRWGLVRAVRAGAFMRAKDAGYLYAGLEHDDWTFGLSYDINLSRLEPASRNRGGFEVTAIRVFRNKAAVPVRFKACPTQM